MGNVQKAKSAASGVPLDCFSPACRPNTFKSQCAVAVQDNRVCFAFDVDGAYLQGTALDDRIVHVRPPPGERTYINGVAQVWRLKKPLYGQADAGRIWFHTAREQLVKVYFFALAITTRASSIKSMETAHASTYRSMSTTAGLRIMLVRKLKPISCSSRRGFASSFEKTRNSF